MSTPIGSLYRLQKKDVPQAAAVLVDAFGQDPVWSAVLSNATPEQILAAFEAPVRYGLRYGNVYAPTQALEGVAVWVPGTVAEMTLWRMLVSGAMWTGMRLGPGLASSIAAVFEPLDRDRLDHTRGRSFIYLHIIGVATYLQGQGAGGQLMRALIEQSDRAEAAIYLETETEGNVRMYEHLGFRVVKEVALPVVNLPMWEMMRG